MTTLRGSNVCTDMKAFRNLLNAIYKINTHTKNKITSSNHEKHF